MNKELIKRLSIITQEEEEILKGQKDIDRDIYTGSSDLVVDSKRLLEKGKLIQIRTHTRFVHFPKHRHNYVEVIYMCQGETTHFIDEQKVVLKKGELLF
ncbi:MAG TPA: AraC family ligand binding domain-containing protein, partial [Candidatus Dorea intestinavium]|nr:AraC family ligand binding domain-containing protein [Candidatus Dorea intestinavium]